MKSDRLFWAVVGSSALVTALGTYSCAQRSAAAPLPQRPTVTAASDDEDDILAPAVASRAEGHPAQTSQTRRLPSAGKQPHRIDAHYTAARREALGVALRAYVRQLRRQGSQSVDASAPAPFDRSKHLPLVEMNWEQYSTWARYGNALATRDYKRVEETLRRIEDLFGPDVANQMADAVVEDYREYLTAIIETECEAQDPQSVWRKTLFMPFLLTRLERPSPELDRMGLEARTHCGYEG